MHLKVTVKCMIFINLKEHSGTCVQDQFVHAHFPEHSGNRSSMQMYYSKMVGYD